MLGIPAELPMLSIQCKLAHWPLPTFLPSNATVSSGRVEHSWHEVREGVTSYRGKELGEHLLMQEYAEQAYDGAQRSTRLKSEGIPVIVF